MSIAIGGNRSLLLFFFVCSHCHSKVSTTGALAEAKAALFAQLRSHHYLCAGQPVPAGLLRECGPATAKLQLARDARSSKAPPRAAPSASDAMLLKAEAKAEAKVAREVLAVVVDMVRNPLNSRR
jgi:hypothetical protein